MVAPSPEPVEQPGAEIVQFRPRNSLNVKVTYARELAQSGLLPAAYKKQPANVLYAVEYGEMLGLSPMAAITGIHIIEGKPTASAALISALVRRAGHRLRVTGNDKTAKAQIIRKDDPDFVFESVWTLDRAKQADLLDKGTWKKYPAAMLKARAITEVARDACEEALCGVHYTPEELGAEVDEEGTPVVNTVSEPDVDWAAQIEACGDDLGKLGELWKRAKGNAKVQADITAKAQQVKAAQAKPEQPEPEVLEAEIVRSVSNVVDDLLHADTEDEIAELTKWIDEHPKDGRQDITGFLSDDIAAELRIDRKKSLTLAQLVKAVSGYVKRNEYNVDTGVALAQAQLEDKAS